MFQLIKNRKHMYDMERKLKLNTMYELMFCMQSGGCCCSFYRQNNVCTILQEERVCQLSIHHVDQEGPKNRNRQIPESVSSTSEFVLTVKVMNFSLIIYLDVFKTILCFVCKIYAVTPEPEYSHNSNTEPTRLDMLM